MESGAKLNYMYGGYGTMPQSKVLSARFRVTRSFINFESNVRLLSYGCTKPEASLLGLYIFLFHWTTLQDV